MQYDEEKMFFAYGSNRNPDHPMSTWAIYAFTDEKSRNAWVKAESKREKVERNKAIRVEPDDAFWVVINKYTSPPKNLKKKHYAARNLFDIELDFDSVGWFVYAFDTYQERDTWVNNDPSNMFIPTRKVIDFATAKKIDDDPIYWIFNGA